MVKLTSDKIYEPWGFQEENNYESVQKQEMENGTAQDAKLKELEDKLDAEIARSTAEDTKHDDEIGTNAGNIESNKGAIEAEAKKNEEQDTEIGKKADKAEVEEALSGKADADKVYTKDEVDSQLEGKADLEHEHEIEDIVPHEGDDYVYLDANEKD